MQQKNITGFFRPVTANVHKLNTLINQQRLSVSLEEKQRQKEAEVARNRELRRLQALSDGIRHVARTFQCYKFKLQIQ